MGTQEQEQQQQQQQQQQLPDHFKCPISLEIMSDPVILSSGHTFDRSSIQRWLDSGHRTCPITKLPLHDNPPLLIPNHSLRSLISHFTLLSSPNSQPCPSSSSSSSSIQTLTSSLTSLRSDSDLDDALSQLGKLTKLDPPLRRQLAESGSVSAAVLRCVGSTEPLIQQKSLALLLNLSLDDDNKVGLVAEGAIDRLVRVLTRPGSLDNRAVACTVLTSLTVVEVNKATIGSYPGAVRALVGLIEEGKGREVKEAATCLYAICTFPGNRVRAVECGAVAVLVRRVVEMGMERAVEVLSMLVKCKEGREEMKRESGCVRALVSIVRNGSERGVQCALFALDCSCSYSERMCREAKREGALIATVGLVEHENDKIRCNAVSLVKTLSGTC